MGRKHRYMGKQDGFTIVETLIALVVFAVFFTFLMQGFIAVQTQRVKVMRYAAANELAASNLRRYPDRTTLPGEVRSDTCTTDGGNLADLTKNKNAPGYKLTVPLTLPAGSSLPAAPNTVQEIHVLYPQGCSANAPIQLKATVKFDSETVTRAQYIN